MRADAMMLTMEQRVATLEREVVVLRDTIKLLHKMLKEQRYLINDYITQKVASGNGRNGEGGRPEDAIYTFVCRKRMDKLGKDIEKVRKLIDDIRFGVRAG
ncbi:unnamed protein product [marine sediment metagenome]|uniref:Uncharacterized protein n=1 Tax=marine sediment metagenome TaxID=412755 RepID=X1D2K3_9ZZZZ